MDLHIKHTKDTSARIAMEKARDIFIACGDQANASMMQAMLDQHCDSWVDTVNPEGSLVDAIDTWVFG